MGFFDKIKQSLTRTKEQFVERFDDLVRQSDEPVTRSRPVDLETLDALEEALISADVGVAAADQIVERRSVPPGAGQFAARARQGRDPRRSCRPPTRRCQTDTRRMSC